MESYGARGTLIWVLNSATSVGVEVHFVARPTDAGWVAQGHLVDLNPDSRDGLALLCDLDGGEGYFELDLEDGSVLEVTVAKPSLDGRFQMREGWPA
ncbi:hypothetical protein [Sporichthya polymorpha]|uniref:hypothetical protein n=1 Tax=Sporichthya polymorpha TaxID=35751 RepID=UPI00036F8C92|nr:hypothetical protein [Sporichthya polymorpha]